MFLNCLYDKEYVKTEFDGEFDVFCDVCVAGLGTAGSFAAIAASRKGVSVIGVEKLGSMGGAGTNGGVYDYFFGNDGGLFEDINEECFEMVKNGYISTDRYENKSSIPGCVKSSVLEKYALKNRCKLYYNTSVTGVFTEADKVIGIRIFKDGQFINIGAKVLLDCTGEAFICRMCNCKMMPGRVYDNQLMRFSKPVGMIYDGYLVSIWCNYDFTDLKDAFLYSKKALESMTIPVALREDYTNNCRVLYESAHIGMREAFCVETEETFTFKDYIAGKKVKEPLFYGFAPLDNTNHDVVFESDEHKDWFVFSSMCDYGFSVGVSKEMLIPKGYDGLMIAAKGIGIGHDLSGLLRMKKDMEKCGEAAGVVAANAAKNNISVKNVPYKEIISELKETGCFDEENNSGLHRLRNAVDGSYPEPTLPESEKDLKRVLSSDNPGTAFWKVVVSDKKKIIPVLKEWLVGENEILKKNSAIALGMIGENSGIETIRKVLDSTPENPEKIYSVRYYPDFAKAIIIAGRLRDEKSVDRLLDIVESDGVKYSENLEVGEYYKTKEDFECCFVALSIEALLKIAEKSPRKDEIMLRVEKWIKSPNKNEPLENIRKIFRTVLENKES